MYTSILERIFHSKYKKGMEEVPFEREEIILFGSQLGFSPKNVGDLIYSFRYRRKLPESIRATADEGRIWVIRPKGIAKYSFELMSDTPIAPNPNLIAIKIPDSTPGIVARYALSDEQALLARLRYNRLIDIFLGIACYSLQNHLRTTVPGIGQVETDEVYVGLDRRGAHYVVPVQAKGGSDSIGIVQIEQDFALCAEKFSNLICRPIAAQFMEDGVIAVFQFAHDEYGVGIVEEKHYRLVPVDQLTDSDIQTYRGLVPDALD